MVVPADAAGTKVKFTATIQDADGIALDYVVTPSFTTQMVQGIIYEFTLTLWPTEMKVGDVSVKSWDVVTGGEGKLQPAE